MDNSSIAWTCLDFVLSVEQKTNTESFSFIISFLLFCFGTSLNCWHKTSCIIRLISDCWKPKYIKYINMNSYICTNTRLLSCSYQIDEYSYKTPKFSSLFQASQVDVVELQLEIGHEAVPKQFKDKDDPFTHNW